MFAVICVTKHTSHKSTLTKNEKDEDGCDQECKAQLPQF